MKYRRSLLFDRPLLIARLKKQLPRSLFNELHRARTLLRTVRNVRGVFPRTCPVCQFSGKFDAAGDPPRFDARCPRCGSLERHRLLKLWLDRRPKGFTLGRVVHFAPEDAVAPFLKPISQEYAGADLREGRADLQLNLEEIALENETVDTVVCSHVMEHVDDGKALKELYRILRPGGKALLMVPIIEGWTETYENNSVSREADRVLHFGQFDHIRYYGSDFRDRIHSAGFTLEEFTATEPDVGSYGLMRGEKLFIASK